MRKSETLKSPREALNDLHDELKFTFNSIVKHGTATTAKERVLLDKKLVELNEKVEEEFLKYQFAFYKMLHKDADEISEIAAQTPENSKAVEELLKEIEELYVDMGKGEFRLFLEIMFLRARIKEHKAAVLKKARKVKGFEKRWEKKQAKLDEKVKTEKEARKEKLKKKREEEKKKRGV